MEKTHIMVNGLPGNVAATMAEAAITDPRFALIPYSLTGPDIVKDFIQVADMHICLVKPDTRDETITDIQKQFAPFIAIDYTHPTAVNTNAKFYTRHNIPFVMGTTGGDREDLEATVSSSQTPAVIAPNMAKQIVGFQAMMAFAAERFPNLFAGYRLEIKESHQQGKADTSGTAKAMVSYFNKLGVNFGPEEIQQIRDPRVQKNQWQIPEQYLSGHGWHTYTLTAPDGSAQFAFTHNVNGRKIYVAGTFDAVLFLKQQVANPERSRQMFTMIDVLNQV
jgi:4-hydroxy-tetrahydrodipicolinate reductase